MPRTIAYFAPLAILLPLGMASHASNGEGGGQAKLDPRAVEMLSSSGPATPKEWRADISRDPLKAEYQVRIERRVTVRITPRSSAPRQSLMAELPQQPISPRFEERRMDDCIPVSDIAGVQTGGGNQLVLFLRDLTMVSARLEKACRARDFYSGFYLERNEDGKLCVDRDKLQSRAGAKCEIARMRELVAVSE